MFKRKASNNEKWIKNQERTQTIVKIINLPIGHVPRTPHLRYVTKAIAFYCLTYSSFCDAGDTVLSKVTVLLNQKRLKRRKHFFSFY